MFTPTVVDLAQLNTDNGLILIVDVDYRDSFAKVSGVIIEDWASERCSVESATIHDVAEYEPGAFWKRELPCIHKVLYQVMDKLPPNTIKYIVIDGYVFFDGDAFQRPGLGAYLNNSLAGEIGIIGVAKTYFTGVPDCAKLLRGDSIKPLFVTSAGKGVVDQEVAKQHIAMMHGEFRLPSMLKFVDQHCRA
jgi:deoxyribonuclease V